MAYRAGALPRAVYESLVTQAGGVPVAAADDDGVEAAVREAILEAKLGSLDKALRAGDISADRYQAMRTGCGAAPGPLPTSSLADEQLPGSVAGNREWNSILRLLLVATEDGEEPPNAKVMIGLEEGAKTASAETCKRAAQWLAERFDDAPGSTDVTLKNLTVASTFLHYGSSTMCNELAQACILLGLAPVLGAVAAVGAVTIGAGGGGGYGHADCGINLARDCILEGEAPEGPPEVAGVGR